MQRFFLKAITATFFLFLSFSGHAKEEVSVEGRLGVGSEVERFKDGHTYYNAKLDVETKRKNGIKGTIGLATDGDRQIFLEDAYIDKKYESDSHLRFGLQKKILGLEYEESNRDRLLLERSLIYQKLEEFAFVGREMILRYESPADESTSSFGYTASLGYAESTDVHAIFSLDQPLSNFHIGNWTLLQMDRVDHEKQFVWTNIFSLWQTEENYRWQLEFFGGQDPFESEFEKTFGDGQSVYFYGVKTQYGYKFSLENGESLEPFASTSMVIHDADSPAYNSIQNVFGVNYFIGNFLFSFNFDLIGTNSRLDTSTRTYDQSSFRSELKVFF